MKRAIAIGALFTFVLASVPARAQDKQTAEALFEEGKRLFDTKDFTHACEKFAASQRMDPAVGTLLNLGRCYEASGKLASASLAYGDAAAQAHRESDPKREKFAAQKESELKALAPRLTINMQTAGMSDVTIERDGKAIDPAVLGVAIPLDPGVHTIKASAAGKETFATTVTLKPSEAARVDVPALKEPSAVPPPAPPTPHHEVIAPPPEPSTGLGTQRTIALVAGGAGVLTLGIGAYFGIHASSLKSDAEPHCFADKTCDADGVSLTDRAGSSADVSTVLFVAGGLLLAGGAVLWFTAPHKSAAQIGIAGTGGVVRVTY